MGQGAYDIHWVKFNYYKSKPKGFVYSERDGLDAQGECIYPVTVLSTCIVYLQYIYKYACNNLYYTVIKPAAVAQSRVKCCCGTELREV